MPENVPGREIAENLIAIGPAMNALNVVSVSTTMD